MPLLDVPELAHSQRLLTIAQSDTGQSRTVASFPLAWWNAQTYEGGGRSPSPRLGGDSRVRGRILGIPPAYGLGLQFETLVTRWRPGLAEVDGHD